ncbi:MAG: NAD-dependent epimerase/dehydratase family protein, partial [Acidobacteriota bacterium]
MAKFLVTGGAGFIGSHLVEHLLEKSQGVVVLDDLSTGKRTNLGPFQDHPGFVLIEGDVRRREDCLRAAEGVDYVLHQAALGSVPRSLEDPLTANAVNIGGHLNILLAARECGVKRVVYAASSSTYGDSRELPKVESRIGR